MFWVSVVFLSLILPLCAGEGWFSLAHKHNIRITSENTRDISVSISISARKTNLFVFVVLMLTVMLMRE